MLALSATVTRICPRCGLSDHVTGVALRFSCPECGAQEGVKASAWAELLAAAARGAVKAAGDLAEVHSESLTIVARREDPRCSACEARLPIAEMAPLAAQGQVACVECGLRVALRAPDGVLAPLAAAGVKLLLGEQSDADRRPGAAFYVLLSQAARGEATDTDGKRWETLGDVGVDRDGNLYAVGLLRGHEGLCAWSLDASLRPRWVAADLDAALTSRIAVTHDGHVLLWSDTRHDALKLSAVDGTALGRLGGREPRDAKVHGLDLKHAAALACDLDGSVIYVVHNRLLRCAPDGAGTRMWPRPLAASAAFRIDDAPSPIYRHDAEPPRDDANRIYWDEELKRTARVSPYLADFEDLGDRPLSFWSHFISLEVGWDGHLYALERQERQLARFDPRGGKVYKVTLPVDALEIHARARADAEGNAYVLGLIGSGASTFRVMVRVSPDGRRMPRVLSDVRAGGHLKPNDPLLAVAPDGGAYVLGDAGSATRFARGELQPAGTKPTAKR